jgi:hypothetical protein
MRTPYRNIVKSSAPRHSTAGSALITVLGVSLILMLAGVTLIVLSSQSIHRAKRLVQNSQAQAVAEAGIADMVAKLGSNYTVWQNATNVATFLSDGIYYVRSQRQSNGNVLITSDGLHMGVSNRTILELLGTTQMHYNDLYNLYSAVLAGGNVDFATAAWTMNGDIHANTDVTSANGAWNGTINGDISACGTIGTLNPTGTITSGVPTIMLPPQGPFNFDSYRQMATNGGVYLEGNQSLSGKPIASPTNGILYVNGNLTIANQSSFTGTIVANGNITIVNHFTQTNDPGIYNPNASNMPSLLSTGTITIQNNTTLNGVVYANVNVILKNNTTINGGVISGGYTDIRNSIEIHHANGYPPWDPLNPEVPPEVISGGWLK